MKTMSKRFSWQGAVTMALLITVVVSASMLGAMEGGGGGHEDVVMSARLPNVPGKTITAVRVNYAPGARSPRHVHAGTVLAYVLAGEIRSENSATGAARVYKAGEAFVEPPGSTHLVSENASKLDSATLLAIFVADDGAQLTTMQKEGSP